MPIAGILRWFYPQDRRANRPCNQKAYSFRKFTAVQTSAHCAFRSGLVIQDLLECGIALYYHYTDEQVRCDGAVDKFMIAARSFAAELEREKTSQRTHEHLMTKARRGFVVGGRVYGFTNVEIREGERRIRVEYRINEAEAKIVREIFRRYADGEGLRTIAQDLQKRGIPAPKAGRRGTGVWSYSSIREMLRRDRYRGRIIWGKREKTYRGGTKVRIRRAKEHWVTLDMPELRIIDDELWGMVQRKIEKHTAILGKKTRGRAPRYLLSGLARCSECGGLIHVARRKESRGNIAAYACSRRKNQGKDACTNSLRRPVEAVDAAVLEWIRDNVLNEEMIAMTLDELRNRLGSYVENATSEMGEIEAQISSTTAELERLSNALLGVNQKPEIVMRMISEREQKLATLHERLANARASPALPTLDGQGLDNAARARLDDLYGLFSRHPEAAHRVMEAMLAGPLTFTPIEDRYQIEGQVGSEWMTLVEGHKAA